MTQDPSRAEEARQRYLESKEGPVEKKSNAFSGIGGLMRNTFSGNGLKIGIGVVLIIVILVVTIWFFGIRTPNTETVYTPATQVPRIEQTAQPVPAPTQNSVPPITVIPTGRASLSSLDWKFYLVSLGLVALFIFALLESQARGDFLLIDFFSSWGLVALLVNGQIYGIETHLFWLLLGAGLLGMIIATFWNPTEENESQWWNRIDTTHWYVFGLALIFIYMIKSPAIPYPNYLPILVPILATVIGAGKEMFRQVMYSLLALAIGIVPAVLQTGTALLVGLAIEIVIAAAGAHQGWITSRGTGHDVSIGGRKFKLYLDWDIVLFYIAEVVLIGYALYGNYVVLTIAR